tara:strand:- start:293 stop:601 length:309 start_codon:yes stop_codon:yes gene_type:complete
MSSQLTLIISLINESETLLALAESADWEAFATLEKRRQAKLKTLDLATAQLSEPEHLKVQTKMKQLIELNEQLTTICRQQRAETITELSKLTAGNKAKKAYS